MKIIDFEVYKHTGKRIAPKGHSANDNGESTAKNRLLLRSTAGENLLPDERGILWPSDSVTLRGCYDM